MINGAHIVRKCAFGQNIRSLRMVGHGNVKRNYAKITKIIYPSEKVVFFANSNIPLPKWLHLMYLWATKASNKQTQLQTGLSNHTIIDAFACLRKICGRYLQENPIQLGGPGIIVPVDESQFSHKPKHHRGRAAEIPIWVFGIVDTSFKPSVGFMEIVENRGAEILLQ